LRSPIAQTLAAASLLQDVSPEIADSYW